MAIIKQQREELTNLLGTNKIEGMGGIDTLIDKAHTMRDSFSRINVNTKAAKPLFMDRDRRLVIARKGRANIATDVSDYAFAQACSIVGVPSAYMRSLYDKGMDELVDRNWREMLKYRMENNQPMNGQIALTSEGVCEALVSNRYSFGFQTPEVLETIRECMPKNYIPNQAYLSKGKMHMRFIDFDNPEYVNGEKMSVGFTVSTSDIGKSALVVRFFLYKFACKNGIVMAAKGGTLYRQSHIGEPFTADNIARFKDAFQDIEDLREESLSLIVSSQNRMMSEGEMRHILDTCRKHNISISEKEADKIISLAEERYGRTKWGVINGITEVAQAHTLDTRIDYETFAGHLLRKVA